MSAAVINTSFAAIGSIDPSLHASTLQLKLVVQPHSVRYYVLSKTLTQVLYFGHYTLHHITGIEELAERLQSIYDKDDVLKMPFGEVIVAVDTDYRVQPAGFGAAYNETTETCMDAELVYTVPAAISVLLRSWWPSVTFRHQAGVWLSNREEYLQQAPDVLLAAVNGLQADIIRFNSLGHLQLMNRYAFKAASDFIYYTLLCCEKLQIDRENTTLILAGEVDVQSKVYDLCYRYFRHITFIQPPVSLSFTKDFDLQPKHFYYSTYCLEP